MTMTNKTKYGSGVGEGVEPEARRLRRELFDDEVLDRLLAATEERGVSLTGEGGFLPEMIKAVLERGMAAELSGHLGYEKGDPAGRGSGNSRNGTTPKTVSTEVGRWCWTSRGTGMVRSRRRWCPRGRGGWAGWKR